MMEPQKRCKAWENFTPLSKGLWTNVSHELPVSW